MMRNSPRHYHRTIYCRMPAYAKNRHLLREAPLNTQKYTGSVCTRCSSDLCIHAFSALVAQMLLPRVEYEVNKEISGVPTGSDAAIDPPTRGELLCTALNYAQGVHADPYSMPGQDSFSWGDEGPRCPREFVTRAISTSSCRRMKLFHQPSTAGDQETLLYSTETGTDAPTVRGAFSHVRDVSVQYYS